MILRAIWVATLLCLAVAGVALAMPAAEAADGRTGGRIAVGVSDGIMTLAPDGTDSRLVVRDAGEPALSADGRWLAYSRKGAIWRVRTDGSGERLVARVPRRLASDPSWSPNGRRVAFTVGWEVFRDGYPEERYAIHVARRDGSKVHKLHKLHLSWGAQRGRPMAG